MADVVEAAAQIWDVYQDDNSILATLVADRKALVLAIAAGTKSGDVIQGSKNGVSYTMRTGFSLQDQLTLLRLAIQGIEANVRPSRNRRIRFS